jgi:hypothetical protein
MNYSMYESRKLLTTFTLSITVSVIQPSFIQPTYANSTTCQAAIQSVKTQLQNQKNVQFVSVTKQDLTDSDRPKGRSHEYMFLFQGTGAANILTSGKFMANLASKVINECKTVGSVTFGFPNSHDFVIVGLMHDGSIKVFSDCVEVERANTAKWGQVVCY